jgi:hypothetical protein
LVALAAGLSFIATESVSAHTGKQGTGMIAKATKSQMCGVTAITTAMPTKSCPRRACPRRAVVCAGPKLQRNVHDANNIFTAEEPAKRFIGRSTGQTACPRRRASRARRPAGPISSHLMCRSQDPRGKHTGPRVTRQKPKKELLSRRNSHLNRGRRPLAC